MAHQEFAVFSLLNLTAGERLDLTDMTTLAQTSLVDVARGVPAGLLVDSQRQAMWVVRGFAMSSPSGQVLKITRGSALLSLRRGAQVASGVLTSDGPESLSVDLSSYSAATYSIFIRFVLVPDAFDTRVFFRAATGGSEYQQSVPTRLVGGWEIAVAAVSPGAEWLKIGEVTTPSMALVDMRPMYFEGRADQGGASGWGSDDDRSDDRAAHGIGDLQTMLAAMRQGLEDVKGGRWYSAFVTGQSIGYAGSPQMGRTSWGDAGFFAQGSQDAPSFSFATDGGALTYRRDAGQLQATGAALASSAGATSRPFAWLSGPDGAALSTGFYRATAQGDASGVDAAVSYVSKAGSAGGIGFYGTSGAMSGPGVGLGYALGAQAPALFVGASNIVGVGLASAAGLIADVTAPLQVAASSTTVRGLGLTDGAALQALVGFANAAPLTSSKTAFTGALISLTQATGRLAVLQNNVDRAALRGSGNWAFGAGSIGSALNAATINVVDSPRVVTGTTFNQTLNATTTSFARTDALALNNTNSATDGAVSFYYPTTLALYNVGQRLFGLSASTSSQGVNFLTIRDEANSFDLLSYNAQTQQTTFRNSLAVVALDDYKFTQAFPHTDTLLGCAGRIRVGTMAQVDGVSFGELAVSNASGTGVGTVQMVVQLPANKGQVLRGVQAYVRAQSGSAASCGITLFRYDSVANSQANRPDVQIGTASATLPASSAAAQAPLITNINETSADGQSWYLRVTFSGSGDLVGILKFVYLFMATPALNPQRQ